MPEIHEAAIAATHSRACYSLREKLGAFILVLVALAAMTHYCYGFSSGTAYILNVPGSLSFIAGSCM
jgi:hypothetical protein